jgi:hypothetical protein
MIRHTDRIKISRQYVLGKTRLFLIQVDRNQLKADRCTFLQIQQNIQTWSSPL